MHKPIILLLSLLSSLIINAQETDESKSILIFSNEPGFLRPFIETTIKELNNVELNKRFFSEVYSLNNFDEDTEIRSKISRILWEQENAQHLISTTPTSDNDILFQDKIINKLTKYDYFLTVRTNTLGELIEFQFQLFGTLKSEPKEGKNYLKRVLIDSELSVENFFINPKKQGYLIEIKNAIQRLFKNSNRKPIADVEIFEKSIKNDDTIYVSKGTTVRLDASNSGDYDSENINYFWRNIPDSNEKYQTFNKVKIKDSVSIQNILIDKNGPFRIGFKVDDGVSESDEIKFILVTKKRPKKIKINDSIFFTVVNKNNLRGDNLSFVHNFNLENIDSLDIIKPILVSKTLLGNKLLRSQKSNVIDTLKIETNTTYIRDKPYKNSYFSSLSFFETNNHNELYLYNISEDSLLSEPTVLKHNTYIRNGISVKFLLSASSIGGKDITFLDFPNDTLGNAVSTAKMKLGYYLSKKSEIGVSFPIQRLERLGYKNHELSYPEVFSGYYNYHWYTPSRFINIYAGLNFNLYRYKSLLPESYTRGFLGLSPEFGATSRLIVTRYFDFRMYFGGSLNTFQHKIFKSLNGEYAVDIGLQFEF